jgi:ATP-dependent Clp protease, protease subunit
VAPKKEKSQENRKVFDPGESSVFPWVNEFTEESAIKFHERLSQQFEENPYRPIIIHINSYGGEVDALFSMLDTMDSIRAMAPPQFKFLTVAMGKAQSAGAALLSYGDYRFATPHSRIMLHQVVGGSWGSHPDNEVEFSETNRMNTHLLRILKRRCKFQMSISELKKMLSHNVYLTPEEARKLGLIDIVGYPKLVEKVLYDVRVVNGEVPETEGKGAHRRANKKAPADQGED